MYMMMIFANQYCFHIGVLLGLSFLSLRHRRNANEPSRMDWFNCLCWNKRDVECRECLNNLTTSISFSRAIFLKFNFRGVWQQEMGLWIFNEPTEPLIVLNPNFSGSWTDSWIVYVRQSYGSVVILISFQIKLIQVVP